MPASTTGRPAAVLSILVTANTRAARANLAALDRQLAYSVKRAGVGATALNRAATAARFAGVGAAAGIAGAVGAAISFESAFASVEKTVEGSRKQLKGVRGDILSLSERVPESANALAELAGEAGALGVHRPAIKEFTKTAAQLGATTQLSAEMAADGLARVANIMDLKIGKAVDDMGNVLVELGNKGASTEGEILEMSKRIAGTGKQIGLTTAQVMGLAAGLANLGIRAEMGGSAISRVLRAMQTAIAEGPSKELDKFAETAGMSVAEFTKAFERDPVKVVGEFADGLNKINKSGGSAQSTLVDLGKAAHTSLGEVRITDTLLRIAGNTEELSRTQQLANKEWRDGNALQVEYRKRAQTLESQVAMLRNELVHLGIDMGTGLLPIIKETVSALRGDDLTLSEKVQTVVDGILDILKKALPEIATIGGQLGLALATGLVEAFWEAPILGKLFIGATFLRAIGGPTVFRDLGILMGGNLAKGIASSNFMWAALAGKAGAPMIDFVNPRLISPVGYKLGQAMAIATRFAIPGAFAAAGIGNIIADVVGGDMRGAGFEIGGALVGGIAGALVGGPVGALIGGGLGTVVGDLVGDLFAKPEELTHSEQLAQRIEETTAAVRELQDTTKSSFKNVRETSDRVKNLRRDEKKATERVIESSQNLARVRRREKGRTEPLVEAESELVLARARLNRITKRAEKAEKEHGFARKAAKITLKDTVATEKEEIVLLQEQRDQFRRNRREELRNIRIYGETEENVADLGRAERALADNAGKLRKSRVRLNNTLAETSERISPKYAKRLRELSISELRFGRRTEDLATTLANPFKDSIFDLNHEYLPTFGQELGDANKKQKNLKEGAKDTEGGVTKAYADMVDKSGESLYSLGSDTNNMLDALGVAEVDFGFTKQRGAGKQRGGLIPGTGDGDKVPIWAEPGEGFINKMAVRAMGGKAAIDEINRAYPRSRIVPRWHGRPGFARGGVVSGDVGGLVPAFMTALQAMAGARKQAIYVSSGLRSRSEQAGLYAQYLAGTGNLAAPPGSSHHEQGIAADISPGREVFGSSAGQFGLGFTVPSESWHIELLNAAAAGKLGPRMQKLARYVLTGPRGGLKRTGQANIDKVWRAASQKIKRAQRRQAATLGGPSLMGGAVPVGPIQQMARQMVNQIWGPGQWGPFNALEMAEAGWNPRAQNASSGAAGLAQALPPSKYPAGAWPYQGLRSAKLQLQWMMGYIRQRYGTPAAAWAFHQSNNWYKRGGVVPPAALPFVGKFHNGGIAPREGLAHVKKGEAIGEPRVVVKFSGDAEWLREFIQVEIEQHGGSRRRMARSRR